MHRLAISKRSMRNMEWGWITGAIDMMCINIHLTWLRYNFFFFWNRNVNWLIFRLQFTVTWHSILCIIFKLIHIEFMYIIYYVDKSKDTLLKNWKSVATQRYTGVMVSIPRKYLHSLFYRYNETCRNHGIIFSNHIDVKYEITNP